MSLADLCHDRRPFGGNAGVLGSRQRSHASVRGGEPTVFYALQSDRSVRFGHADIEPPKDAREPAFSSHQFNFGHEATRREDHQADWDHAGARLPGRSRAQLEVEPNLLL